MLPELKQVNRLDLYLFNLSPILSLIFLHHIDSLLFYFLKNIKVGRFCAYIVLFHTSTKRTSSKGY